MVKVSVCTITYNHAAYIAQAIESVLMQRGPDLEIEMVIGDDVSSDNTRAIVADYAIRYPDVIKPLFHAKNLGPGANSRACLAACTGEFIAALEGDDYWTDPDKLRLQIAALRARPDCMLCFHDAETFDSDDNLVLWTFSEKYAHILPPVGTISQCYTQKDIARLGWFMPTASMLLRASSIPKPLPQWFSKVLSGDYTLQLLSTTRGPALYLPKVMSRYRLHNHSLTRTTAQSGEQFKPRILEAKVFQQEVLLPENRKYADLYLANQYAGYAHYLGGQGRRLEQLRYMAQAIFYNPKRLSQYILRYLRQSKGPENSVEN